MAGKKEPRQKDYGVGERPATPRPNFPKGRQPQDPPKQPGKK